MYYFENVIEEIEKRITDEIDIGDLAKMLGMSAYEFRRVFTFVAKIPLGEYIRKRRLSLAAAEIYKSDKSITYFAEKYGYDSPSSFSRAFRDFHGVSPTEVQNGSSNFRLFTKISAEITVSGCDDIAYSICEKDAYTVSGFSACSPLTDTECCEDVWSAFYESDVAQRTEENELYAVYGNKGDLVNCLIGIEGGELDCKVTVPASKWAIFKLDRTDDEFVNEFYNSILSCYIESAGFVRNSDVPNVEVYPCDMSQDGFEWEIHIPIKKR